MLVNWVIRFLDLQILRFWILPPSSFLKEYAKSVLVNCYFRKAPVLLVNDYNTSLVGGNTLQQSQHLHRPQILQDALHVRQSQHRLQTQELQVADVLQGPRTPFSKPPFSGKCGLWFLPHWCFLTMQVALVILMRMFSFLCY